MDNRRYRATVGVRTGIAKATFDPLGAALAEVDIAAGPPTRGASCAEISMRRAAHLFSNAS